MKGFFFFFVICCLSNLTEVNIPLFQIAKDFDELQKSPFPSNNNNNNDSFMRI